MEYVSLYRKYRPSKFEDVVGQTVVIKILQNAIKNNKINHAYLFSGPRGTGKTSIAKIFSKAVNCLNNDSDVCNKCEVCTKNFDELIDIIEIDAASNNGVDEIREIRNSSKLLPTYLKYKVYIIDEVHMLSISAFNALLKTLEEPPQHVIFILATTEINKIPTTVLSRCQKFDFKKISEIDIYNRLKYILNEENKFISDNILKLISKISDGGLRDAINLLDQLLSLNKEDIDEHELYNIIGDVSQDEIVKIFDYVVESNIKKVIDIINNYYENGININNVINKLEYLVKDLLIYNNTKNYFDQNYENILAKYTKIDLNLLIKISNELFELNFNIRKGNNYKNLIEIYFIRLCLLFSAEKKDNNEKNIEIDNNENIGNIKITEEKEDYLNDEDKNILINNALALADKNEKKDFLEKYINIKEYITEKKYNSIINLLIKSTPEVVSTKNIIFTFKNDFEILLFNKNMEDIVKFLKKIYDKKYDVVSKINMLKI